MSPDIVKALIRPILRRPFDHEWTKQGFGFLRLRLDDNTRLHIWDSALRTPGASDIHDHLQWHFKSTILAGGLCNTLFTAHETQLDDEGALHTAHVLFMQSGIIDCGAGGGNLRNVRPTFLTVESSRFYGPGEWYAQENTEVHRTSALDGTVTLIEQERTSEDTANVFWPRGGEWVTAEPSKATEGEIRHAVMLAREWFE